MRRPAASFLLVAALGIAAGAASASELRGVTLQQTESGTRAELDLDSASGARVFTLSNPDRLVIDLPETRAIPGLRLPGANGAVASLRTGQPTPGTLRVVFDLGLPVVVAHHVESAGSGRRLVIDLDASRGRTVSDPGLRSDAPAVAMQPSRAPTLAASGSVPTPLADAPPTVVYADPSAAHTQADASVAPSPWSSPGASVSTGSPLDAVAARMSDTSASTPFAPVSASTPPISATARLSASVAQASQAVTSPRIAAPAPVATPGPAAMQAAIGVARPRDATKTMQDVIGRGERELIVAIDAGHGGKDPGAHGPTGVREKVVTLAVARELARQIDADPGMRAVLIRDGDSFVPLQRRYMKARAAQADLFVSIHADASPNGSATGASVYVLSTRGASSQAARWLADSENAADLVGGVQLDAKDPNLAAVLLDLSQSATMRASDDVAGQVLASLKSVGKAHKPSIERANFVVLRSPDVPSMLVETGFITNPDEERKLDDPVYRARLAAAIAEGVRRYFVGQPPPGSWFAARGAGGAVDTVASAPE